MLFTQGGYYDSKRYKNCRKIKNDFGQTTKIGGSRSVLSIWGMLWLQITKMKQKTTTIIHAINRKVLKIVNHR